jgi:hypothetical protein
MCRQTGAAPTVPERVALQSGRQGWATLRKRSRMMIGCLVLGVLIILLFVLVPIPLWPLLIVALIVLLVIAAALGLLKGIVGAIFGRH